MKKRKIVRFVSVATLLGSASIIGCGRTDETSQAKSTSIPDCVQAKSEGEISRTYGWGRGGGGWNSETMENKDKQLSNNLNLTDVNTAEQGEGISRTYGWTGGGWNAKGVDKKPVVSRDEIKKIQIKPCK